MTTTETNSFYVTGGTLQRDAACYVRRRADQALYDGLMQGNFCYVLTSRQMGKSSLMVRTAARLREEGVHVAVLDLTSIGQNLNAEQWYDGLLARVGQQFQLEDELEDFWLNHSRLSPLLRWMKAIRDIVLPRCAGRIIIFVDEIDAVRSLPFSTDEFFAAIRELYNRRTEDAELERLTFCLLGVATPSDLIRDTRTTPFNIGQRIELSDFTDDEAAPLARGLGREDKTAAKLLKRILYWTGGHPYLTQRLCQATAEDANVNDAAGIDRLCEELFFTTRARERDDNLLFVRERMLKSEADRAALLDLYKKLRDNKRVKDDETNPLVSVLRLSGITRVAEGLLYVRNRIYYRVFDREWVLANLPDAEVQRQRAAYRRGLLRAAAVAAVIVAALSVLSFVAIRQRNRAVQSEQANQRLLYTAHMNLAAQDWEGSNLGRMRELLDGHIPAIGQKDERGFEWFYLWQLANGNIQKLSHKARMAFFSLSRDEKQLAASDENGDITIWATSTWQKLKTISKGDGPTLLRFSPDSQKLATLGQQGRLKLHDLINDREITLNDSLSINALGIAFSPDGTKLVVGYRNGTIKLWDTNTWQESLSIHAHQAIEEPWAVYRLDFSPDGKFLASAAWDKVVKIWDPTTGKEINSFKAHTEWIHFVRFSPDSHSVAYVDGPIFIRDVVTGKELLTLKNEDGTYAQIFFSPDGGMIASPGFDKIVKVWETKTGRELFSFKGAVDLAGLVVFVQGGKKLMAFDDNAAVLTWDLANKPETAQITTGERSVGWSVFSPDRKIFATADNPTDGVKGKARIWDAVTGKELFALGPFARNEVGIMRFISDGKHLIVSSGDNNGVEVLDVEVATQQIVHKFRPNVSGFSWISGIASDGSHIVVGSRSSSARTLKVLDVKTGQERFSVNDTPFGSGRSEFSPDGSLVALGMSTKISLCDAQTGKEVHAFNEATGVSDMAFSPDRKKLATGTPQGNVIMYEVNTGRKIFTIKGHASFVTSIAFSPDGKRLATTSYDQKVKLWDTDNGQELLTLSGHTDYVWSVAFSPDGKALLSTSKDKTIRLWRAATDADVQARRGQ